MFEAERKALANTFKMPMPTMRQTMEMAALYAAQAVVCVTLLQFLFDHFHFAGAFWAIISSILALQPGLSQSVVTSVLRIAATFVGAGAALLVSWVHFKPEFQLLTALVAVVFVCELLRLDLALRTACVAVVIVLYKSEGHVRATAEDRFFATLAGCLMALLVQLLTDVAWKKLARKRGAISVVKS